MRNVSNPKTWVLEKRVACFSSFLSTPQLTVGNMYTLGKGDGEKMPVEQQSEISK